MDWEMIFIPDIPVLEIVLHGIVTYIALFFMLRVPSKRQSSSVGMSDLLLLVLIADASQMAMASEYTSVANGLILVGMIMFWTYVFDWLSYKSTWFGHLIEHRKLQCRNMRQELISKMN